MLDTVEKRLKALNLYINASKSHCLRIGPRHRVECATLTTNDMNQLAWSPQVRYLGVWISSARVFKCDFSAARRSFSRAANAIFSRVGSTASEEVVLQLIKVKCLPILLYGTEAVELSRRDLSALDFSFTRFVMKTFKCSNLGLIREIMVFMGLDSPSVLVQRRQAKFNRKYSCCKNSLCNAIIMLL